MGGRTQTGSRHVMDGQTLLTANSQVGKDIHYSFSQSVRKGFVIATTHKFGSTEIRSSLGIDTFLENAAATGNYESVEWAYNICLEENIVDKVTLTKSLLAAVRNGHFNIVELLLKKNPLLDVKTDGDTCGAYSIPPLLYAILNRDFPILRELCKHVDNINDPVIGGLNPLHIAALFGLCDVARILVDYNANIDAKTKSKDTARKIANAFGHKDMAKLLKKLRDTKGRKNSKTWKANEIIQDESLYNHTDTISEYHHIYLKPEAPGENVHLSFDHHHSEKFSGDENIYSEPESVKDDYLRDTAPDEGPGHENVYSNTDVCQMKGKFKIEDRSYFTAEFQAPEAGRKDENYKNVAKTLALEAGQHKLTGPGRMDESNFSRRTKEAPSKDDKVVAEVNTNVRTTWPIALTTRRATTTTSKGPPPPLPNPPSHNNRRTRSTKSRQRKLVIDSNGGDVYVNLKGITNMVVNGQQNCIVADSTDSSEESDDNQYG